MRKEFCDALGCKVKKEVKFAPPIHPELAADWSEFLEVGFSKEKRDEAREEFLVPANGKFLRPPKLNVEVDVALPVKRRERDYRITDRQASVSSALAGLSGILTTLMASNKPENAPLIRNLSSVSRILLDAFREDTGMRRVLASANLNSVMQAVLQKTTVGEFLFGDTLVEDIKAAKQISQSASELKIAKPPVFAPSKNQRPLPRRSFPPKAPAQGGSRQTYRPYVPRPTYARRPQQQQSQYHPQSRTRKMYVDHKQRSYNKR